MSSVNNGSSNNPNFRWADLPYVDKSEFGDKDAEKDKINYDKLVAGEWVDTREQADSFEINSYSSEEFFFDGFGTDINNGTSNNSTLTNALGQSANEVRNKILEMANKIIKDCNEDSYKKALPGDVILKGTGKGKNFSPSHTGIYMGDKKMAHASTRKDQSNGFKPEILISDVESKDKITYFCRSKELIKIDSTKSEGSGQFAWPVPSSGRVTDVFGTPRSGGRKHSGIDVGAAIADQLNKDAIVASDTGTVTYSGWSNGYGYLVKIDHGNGYSIYFFSSTY